MCWPAASVSVAINYSATSVAHLIVITYFAISIDGRWSTVVGHSQPKISILCVIRVNSRYLYQFRNHGKIFLCHESQAGSRTANACTHNIHQWRTSGAFRATQIISFFFSLNRFSAALLQQQSVDNVFPHVFSHFLRSFIDQNGKLVNANVKRCHIETGRR